MDSKFLMKYYLIKTSTQSQFLAVQKKRDLEEDHLFQIVSHCIAFPSE